MLNHDSLRLRRGRSDDDSERRGQGFYLLFANALDNVPLTLPQGTRYAVASCRAFSPFQTPGQWKVFPMVRPIIRTQATPSVRLTVLTDFNLTARFSVRRRFRTSRRACGTWICGTGLWSGFARRSGSGSARPGRASRRPCSSTWWAWRAFHHVDRLVAGVGRSSLMVVSPNTGDQWQMLSQFLRARQACNHRRDSAHDRLDSGQEALHRRGI